jgi:hypothetical protein
LLLRSAERQSALTHRPNSGFADHIFGFGHLVETPVPKLLFMSVLLAPALLPTSCAARRGRPTSSFKAAGAVVCRRPLAHHWPPAHSAAAGAANRHRIADDIDS